MKASELPEIEDTTIEFPDGLRDFLKAYSWKQVRRRILVFLNDQFMPRPQGSPSQDKPIDYIINTQQITFPHPLKSLDVVSIVDLGGDERWYYTHVDGWGRM